VCGHRGCWEAYASGTAFTLRARKIFQDLDRYPDARAIFDAAREGNESAQTLVNEEADWLGLGIANLLHLYSPELLVLGGGVSNNFDLLREGIMTRINTCAMGAFRDVRVVPAMLGDNPGLVGAAALLFDPIRLTSRVGIQTVI
jgi:glucokinase